MSHARWSLVAALFTMVLWGVNFAFVKYLLDTLGVGAFLFIRFVSMPLLAFLLLLLVFRRHIARTWPKREDLPRFIACGLIGANLAVGNTGVRFNPFRKMLVSANLLFALTEAGLRDRVTPVISLDYSF